MSGACAAAGRGNGIARTSAFPNGVWERGEGLQEKQESDRRAFMNVQTDEEQLSKQGCVKDTVAASGVGKVMETFVIPLP